MIVDCIDLIPHYALFYFDEHHIKDYESIVIGRGVNETRQLASYSDSTWSKLDSCELDSKC